MRPDLLPRFRPLLAPMGLVLGLACSQGDGGTPPSVLPARLVLVTAPAATATSGSPLAPQPILQAVDLAGTPVQARGLLVTAAVASGEGTLEGGTEIRTGADGRAVFTDLALRGVVGARTLRFSSAGLSSAISGSIQLEAGAASKAAIQAGNNQTVVAGTAVPVVPKVKVLDGSDNPVAGVQVTFEVTQGGGNLTGAQALTGADGVATLGQWTLGTATGPNALRATVAGLSAPLVFTATAIVGPAALLTVFEGDGQQVGLGESVPVAPAVRVTDVAGNPVSGVTITFAVASGGGTLTGGAAVSSATGVARVGSWRLGLLEGEQTLTATRQGVPSVTIRASTRAFSSAALALGAAHSCALAPEGLRCWGDNSLAQYGSGSDVRDSLPVPGGANLTLTAVTAGSAHMCGLTTNGEAWCWGSNSQGQLGDSTGFSRLSPVRVVGGHTFKALSAGAGHTCGIRTDGAAYCWGQGGNGRLGSGDVLTLPFPVAVAADSGTTWLTIHAGLAHTCARRSDNVVLCWGSNSSGRLGDGTTTDRSTPTPIVGTWVDVAVGGSHTCALTAAGQVFCWGLGTSGQLGVGGTPSQVTLPSTVSATPVFRSIWAATASTCALTDEGAAWCWGNNGNGRLGDGSTTNRSEPTAVSGGARYASLALGSEHACGRLLSGTVVCWGRNAEGQIGDGSTQNRLTPVGVKRP